MCVAWEILAHSSLVLSRTMPWRIVEPITVTFCSGVLSRKWGSVPSLSHRTIAKWDREGIIWILSFWKFPPSPSHSSHTLKCMKWRVFNLGNKVTQDEEDCNSPSSTPNNSIPTFFTFSISSNSSDSRDGSFPNGPESSSQLSRCQRVNAVKFRAGRLGLKDRKLGSKTRKKPETSQAWKLKSSARKCENQSEPKPCFF